MPVTRLSDGTPQWRHATARQSLVRWFGWLLLLALFVFCWQLMTKDTIWAFFWDAPRQAADIGGRMFPPRWSYIGQLWRPLLDTLTRAEADQLAAWLAEIDQ